MAEPPATDTMQPHPPAPPVGRRSIRTLDAAALQAAESEGWPVPPPRDTAPGPSAGRTPARLLSRLHQWSGQRELSLRQLKQELDDAATRAPEPSPQLLALVAKASADLLRAQRCGRGAPDPDQARPLRLWRGRYGDVQRYLHLP